MAFGYLATFAVALVLSLVLTPLAAAAGRRLGLVDRPRVGEVQRRPVARSGGYAIFAAFVVAVGLSLLLVPRNPEESRRVLGFTLGALLLLPLGAADDALRLGALPQLVGHIAIAAVPVLFGVAVHSVANPFGPPPFGGVIPLPAWIGVPFGVLWIVALINTMNWLDTMDGLAAGITTIAAAILFLVSLSLRQDTIALLPLALAGACLGFLRYNFNPARVIMGTCGSMLLGYSLAVISIIGGAKIATTVLVLGIPIVDALLVIAQRSLHGRQPWQGGDDAHLTHRLLGIGLSQRGVALLLYALCALFGWLATFLIRSEKLVAFVALAIVLGGLVAFVRLRGQAHLGAAKRS